MHKAYKLSFELREDPWGKLGKDSIFNRLGLLNLAQRSKKIGEAWAGAHPQRPSQILNSVESISGENLLELVKNDPEHILGKKAHSTFGSTFPFLFKILTIGSPLSIQVHPNQKKAEELHQRHPSKYLEPKHKPEIGFAISETSLLFGFRELDEIRSFAAAYPPLVKILKTDGTLETAYRALMNCKSEVLTEVAREVEKLIRKKDNLGREEQTFLSLQNLFPGDVGVFQVFVLNLLTLPPGTALFIPASTPHAYLEGEIVECMAASDFVIRAGLTPKEKDLPALLETIVYEPTQPKTVEFQNRTNSNFKMLKTTAREFQIELANGKTEETFIASDSPVLYFAFEGSGEIAGAQLGTPELLLVPGEMESHRVLFQGQLFRVIIPVT